MGGKGTLEDVLDGMDLDTKSRIHQIARQYDIPSNDPLFVVLAATGRLEILVEQAPSAWDKILKSHIDQLDQWYAEHSDNFQEWRTSSQEAIKADVAKSIRELIQLAQQKERQKQGKVLISKSNLGTLIGVSTVFGALIVFFLMRLFPVQASLEKLNDRLNNTDIRLERIEQSLGINPAEPNK